MGCFHPIFMADVDVSSYVWIPLCVFLQWCSWVRITEVSGFKCCCSSESTCWRSCGLGSRMCRTCSEAQSIALAAIFPVLWLLGNLRAWCHFHNLFSKPYSPFWNTCSVHGQPKLISIGAFHHSLHAVPERLLRRWHLAICPFAEQMPSLFNNSVILSAAVIYCLLLLVLM